MNKPEKYEIVLWEDPSSDFSGWIDLDKMQASSAELVFSIGWPAREDETHLYLVMDWSEGKGNTVGKIPLTAIKKRKSIKLRGFPPKDKPEVINETQQS